MSDGYTRGRSFNLCLLASARAAEDPHEAVRVGSEALAVTAGLESQRTLTYLRELRHRLTPYAELSDVADFRHRVLAIATRAD
ncbi:hypothetical protein ABZV58_22885 [Nocardia sp. NPDC004654]|uniref:hypothetical protein n=1 Tax=Nocardia sp. NPDC004654 TaxID=3154776 RepID=UPI0033A1C42B